MSGVCLLIGVPNRVFSKLSRSGGYAVSLEVVLSRDTR